MPFQRVATGLRYSQRRSKVSRSELCYDCLQTHLGRLCIVYEDKGNHPVILKIIFGKAGAKARKKPLPDEIKNQFLDFIAGKRRDFSLDYTLEGTDFEMKVWQLTATIPYGETRTYKWIAERMDKPRSVRAVGQALKRNPLPLIIPCHRVIKSDGDLGGYSSGVDIKRRLLEMEYYINLSTKH